MMMDNQAKEQLAKELRDLVENNILRYWMEKMVDMENGGFYGRRDGHNQLDPEAPKAAVLNGRILWAFSAAYRVLGNPNYLLMAKRAKDYIFTHFVDREYGGIYWTVNSQGEPLDTKKHVYVQAVVLFALSEFVRATGDQKVLGEAKEIFYNIEGRTADAINSGYNEAMDRTWRHMGDVRLSDKDELTERSLNTHLHLLEAYTCLYKVWPREVLANRLRRLMGVMLEKMVNPETSHFGMFFSDGWQEDKDIRSYGHSIEAAWLLLDAAYALNDVLLKRHVTEKVVRLVKAADEGLRPNGGMIYMSMIDDKDGLLKHIEEYHWWVQAENVLGHWYLYQHLGDEKMIPTMMNGINFIKEHLVDWQNGEWFWSCDAMLSPNQDDDKAGMWKDPSHNTRLCISLIEGLTPL